MKKYTSVLDQLMAHVKVNPNTDCWEWTASLNKGYGQVNVNQKILPAHRVMYELKRGLIPLGQDLDHLCRVSRCINPKHLEPVSHRENLLRGVGWAGLNSKKTHCKNGHLLSDDNIIWRNGRLGRECRICRLKSKRREFQRNHAKHMARRKIYRAQQRELNSTAYQNERAGNRAYKQRMRTRRLLQRSIADWT